MTNCLKFISKDQDTINALNGVSFGINEGEIFCLLGHNGAGKTTTINILTGLYPATRGDGWLYGHSITYDIEKVRKLTGICPQYDTLWGELTAREHLILFARLKGVQTQFVTTEVNAKLNDVDLLDAADKQVDTFSGGMKRRLSLAIAIIGDPKVLFLDEPTTGMDPVNRRQAWKMIQKMKENRVIILTTHSMEEADCLGDRIAIMAHGKLRCIGNSLKLKNKFGSGYRINIVTTGAEYAQDLVHQVTQRLPDAEIVQDTHHQGEILSINVPYLALSTIPEFLSWLEMMEEKGEKVKEWGISHSTLESVFLGVTAQSGFQYDADLMSGNTSESREMHETTENSNKITSKESRQFRALFSKNASVLRRQRGQICCQVFTPTFIMVIMIILQMIIAAEIGSSKTVAIPEIPYPLNGNILQQSNSRECLEFFAHSVTSRSRKTIGFLHSDGQKSKLLGKIFQKQCQLVNSTDIQVPYFTESYNDSAKMYHDVYQDLMLLNSIPLPDLDEAPLPAYVTPDGIVAFDEINETSLSYSFAINDNRIAKYHRANNMTRLDNQFVGRFNQSKVLLVPQGRLALMDMINKAFLHMIYPTPHSTFNRIMDLSFAITMAEQKTTNIVALVEVFGSFLFPIALTLQLPIYLFLIAMEKEGRLREMQKCMGMSMTVYWIVNYLFDLFLYFIVVTMFWLSGWFVGLRFFTQTSAFLLVIFFVGWGIALVSFGFLLSAFVSSKRFALVVGYVVSLFGTVIALVVCDGIYGNIPGVSLGAALPTWMYIHPIFGLARGIYLMNFACAAEMRCYDLSTLSTSNELTTVIFSLYINGVVHLILALYLDAIVPSQYGVPKHPLFPCQWIKHSIWPKQKHQQSRSSDFTTTAADQIHLLEDAGESGEDENVAAERIRISQNDDIHDCPVVLDHLRKEFKINKSHDNKVALNNLSLAIDKGECFGLLGENGAGKTTTLNMLTGVFPPTSGTGKICGFNIATDMPVIHKLIGVCPQHDILWESLTVKEHLLYYARVKGVPSTSEEEHVNNALINVGLNHQSHQQAKFLSGGMKRRLSVAISLIGHSRVVFLDEPTTGLDPTSRRQIWKIIENAKTKREGRAIVLTTHSMDEAELLCSRIGILTYGRLRCIGTQQHLKNKYGSGYRMELNYDIAQESSVHEFIAQHFANATIVSAVFQGHMELHLPQHVQISQLFYLMERKGQGAGILDWAVGQISLEDVFHQVVHMYSP